jgi:hypothetical protein
VTNALACRKHSSITALKGYITLVPDGINLAEVISRELVVKDALAVVVESLWKGVQLDRGFPAFAPDTNV